MSLVGMGRAFNLRFMPNGPLRTNCYHRPMPQIGMFGGGNYSYTENVNIQNGPSGFWGFMTGLTQGLFGGGMFGMGMGGGIFGLLNSRQATVSQGTGDQKNQDLDNLNAFFGGKGYVIRQEKDGTYTAAKDGKIVASGKYDDVKAKLSELADETTTDEAASTPEAKAKTHKPPLTKDDDGKWKDANGNEYVWDADNKCFDKQEKLNADTDRSDDGNGNRNGNGNGNDPGADVGDGNRHVSRVRGSRVRGSDGSHQAATGYIGTIKHKAANGDIITKDEKGNTHFYKNDNGKYKEISEKEFRAIHNKAGKKSNINISNIKNGGYSSQKGTRVTGKAGRYAEKNGDSWNYYANDGTKLKPEYVKKVDPELWAKTHPKAKPQGARTSGATGYEGRTRNDWVNEGG